eukprot:COSAG01_NODE_73284_length_248_cov_87.550336_1_plen_31_part_01
MSPRSTASFLDTGLHTMVFKGKTQTNYEIMV